MSRKGSPIEGFEKKVLSYPECYTVNNGQLVVWARYGEIPIETPLAYILVCDASGDEISREQLNHNMLSRDYSVVAKVAIPKDAAGVFDYFFEDTSGTVIEGAQFCVFKPPKKISGKRVALLHPTYTWQAYCLEGGESFYRGEQFETKKVIELDLRRDLRGLSDCHRPSTMKDFSSFLSSKGVDHSNFDSAFFNENLSVLKEFDLLVLAGHDEYLTHGMYDSIESLLKEGGSCAAFSANILCWAVETNGHKLYVDKSHVFKPFRLPWIRKFQQRNKYVRAIVRRFEHTKCFTLLFSPETKDSRSSGQFRQPWINRQQQALFGLSYFAAGYPTSRIPKERACTIISPEEYDQSGNIRVLKIDHPIFQDVEVEDQVLVTSNKELLDIEVDGVFLDGDEVDHYRFADIPKNTRVLASALVNVAYANPDKNGRVRRGLAFEELGIISECTPFNGGGRTIQIGSVGWYKAAQEPDSNEARLTLNIVKYLLAD